MERFGKHLRALLYVSLVAVVAYLGFVLWSGAGEAWRAEVAFAERFVAGVPDLDVTGDDPWRGPISARWVLVHMIEEIGRHAGHADILREQLDGATGR